MLYVVGMFMHKVKQDELFIVEISKILILCECMDSDQKCTFFLCGLIYWVQFAVNALVLASLMHLCGFFPLLL